MTQFILYTISIISLLGTFGLNIARESQLSTAAVYMAGYEFKETLPEINVVHIPEINSASKVNDRETLVEPIAEFKNRITKKPFGIYITPETSPVQPDKFTGYHTGVDIEYDDAASEVPVVAIADGKAVLSRFATGYGGVVVLSHKIEGKDTFVLYGHLDPKTMVPLNSLVKRGEVVGYLGEHKSAETDGARKHLHFAILKMDTLNIRGYVKTTYELGDWHDPLKFFP